MKNRAFERLLKQLEILTPTQKQIIETKLHQTNGLESVQQSIDQVKSCPNCHSQELHRCGTRSNLQRYRCKACHKTFNALTGTPLARLRHKEVWADYIQDLIDGVSIRKSADHCGVNKNTTFRWRHRMLNNSKKPNSEHLSGIVEFDETYFLESHKGERHLDRKARHRGGKASKRGVSSEQIAVLVARDRNGHTMDAILFKSNKDTIAEIILPIVDEDALLCSDSKPSYKAFAKKYHRILKTINANAKEYVKDVYHIQNVNAYDSRLKGWIQHFNGVSTKYLESYLGWMRLLDTRKSITPEELLGVVSRRNMICLPLM